jgi:hypothetical protein
MTTENKTDAAKVDSSDLFAWTTTVKKTRADQILDAFERFHVENPEVWKLFKQFSLNAHDAGRQHYSAKAVFERIRWHIEIETLGGEVKLNNNFTAHYARMFHIYRPDLDGFFRNRKLTSEADSAADDDKQVFIDQQAGEEQAILSRLRSILNTNKEITGA